MRTTLHQHRSFTLKHDVSILLGPIVLEEHHACIVAFGVTNLQHFGKGGERIAVEHRALQPDFVHAQFSDGVLGRILRRQSDVELRRYILPLAITCVITGIPGMWSLYSSLHGSRQVISRLAILHDGSAHP